MIFAYNPSQNLNFHLFANLAYNFAYANGKIALLQVVAILRDPYKMMLNFVFRMTSASVFHSIFIKQLLAESYPAEAGGFNLKFGRLKMTGQDVWQI